mmetsp:Transcript_23368/g.63119  ORF Transcript_23368/g.63119 Transcript_23368/m.63119 type:complete len:205 (-) Transcript_23368:105-719(-)
MDWTLQTSIVSGTEQIVTACCVSFGCLVAAMLSLTTKFRNGDSSIKPHCNGFWQNLKRKKKTMLPQTPQMVRVLAAMMTMTRSSRPFCACRLATFWARTNHSTSTARLPVSTTQYWIWKSESRHLRKRRTCWLRPGRTSAPTATTSMRLCRRRPWKMAASPCLTGSTTWRGASPTGGWWRGSAATSTPSSRRGRRSGGRGTRGL